LTSPFIEPAKTSEPSESQSKERTESRPKAKPISQKPPHEILGVKPGASSDEIRQGYHRVAQMYHPDKVANLGPEFKEIAEQKMKQINAAYEELKSRVK